MPRVRRSSRRADDDTQRRDTATGAGDRRKAGRPPGFETECKARLDKIIALLEAMAYQATGYAQERETYLAGVYHAIRQGRPISRQNHQKREKDSVGVSGEGHSSGGEEPGNGSDAYPQ